MLDKLVGVDNFFKLAHIVLLGGALIVLDIKYTIGNE